jgi:type IV pilus assembly protein PilC
VSKFAYVGVDSAGKTLKGVEEAGSMIEARLRLMERDLQVTELAPKRGFTDIELTTARVKREDLMHLSRQLA